MYKQFRQKQILFCIFYVYYFYKLYRNSIKRSLENERISDVYEDFKVDVPLKGNVMNETPLILRKFEKQLKLEETADTSHSSDLTQVRVEL